MHIVVKLCLLEISLHFQLGCVGGLLTRVGMCVGAGVGAGVGACHTRMHIVVKLCLLGLSLHFQLGCVGGLLTRVGMCVGAGVVACAQQFCLQHSNEQQEQLELHTEAVLIQDIRLVYIYIYIHR
jgi:hypothetical protein